MITLRQTPFIVLVGIFLSAFLSCSEDDTLTQTRKYGTYVRPQEAVFLYDQDSCPYLPVQGPTYTEEELKRMLIGYKWAEVRDSAYKIQKDGTCTPMRAWRWGPAVMNKEESYSYYDLHVLDSFLIFFDGNYDWKEREAKGEQWYISMKTMKCSFEAVGYRWVSEFNLFTRKKTSILQIVYIDGQIMQAIRWFPVAYGSLNPLPYSLTTFCNEGPYDFVKSFLADKDSLWKTMFQF